MKKQEKQLKKDEEKIKEKISKIKQNKLSGITLIALVITIIVLLILAGVSIATLTGENGILTKATEAKQETQKSSEKEQRRLAMMEASMNTENTTFKGVTIPAGFAPTRIEGESTIDEGLVIIDSEGNEFVWVPVNNPNSYIKNTTYNLLDVSKNTVSDEKYLPNDLIELKGKTEEEIEKELVTEKKGFYISRYEAGDELAELNRTNGQEIGKVVSKKDKYVYNFISQSDAKELSKKFVNNNYVKSGLITGIQWDMVMEFIDGKKDAKGEEYNVRESFNFRHKGKDFGVDLTGNNEYDKVCNIYDLEGNCREYVASRNTFYTEYPLVFRGGFYNGEHNYCASQTGGCDDKSSNEFTFRFVLYIM